MKDEVIKLISKIIDPIADALCFLDFSYIISGGIAYGMMYAVVMRYCSWAQTFVLGIAPWLFCTLSIVCAYMLGHTVSAMGYGLRYLFKNVKYPFFRERMYYDFSHEWEVAHQSIGVLREDDDESAKSRYTYYWNLLTQCKDAEDRVKYINRYWVMQKMYEGLMIDVLAATIIAGIWYYYRYIMLPVNGASSVWRWVMLVALVSVGFLGFLGLCHQATKAAKTQVHEVVSACNVYCANQIE